MPSLYVSESGQVKTECGLRCELHPNQCDFFVITLSHCYLGLYSHWNQGTIQDNTERITYHRTLLAKNYIFTPNYLKINYSINWANLIYKTHEDYGRVTFYRCFFECYGDTLCDFFVYDYDNGSPDCYYGRFSLNDGSTYSMKNLNIYLKNGKKLGLLLLNVLFKMHIVLSTRF